MGRREKYGAKLVVDLAVQRAGDAAAALAFHVLDVTLRLGPAAVAAAGAASAGVCLGAALRLGGMHEALQAERAERRLKHVV